MRRWHTKPPFAGINQVRFMVGGGEPPSQPGSPSSRGDRTDSPPQSTPDLPAIQAKRPDVQPGRNVGGLRQEICHGDTRAGSGERAEDETGPKSLDRPIAPPTTWIVEPAGLSVDFENPIHEVDDPVFRNARAGEGSVLARPIKMKTGQRDLDHQRGIGGVRV